ncbi:MAG: thylakoid-associated protein [Cyanobacteria bacterium RI_101]|nr:thylakoid-associated protein [Cyanobacteria bacterium RI_101]MEB3173920.1 thylakoid-associated protein [Cyanobacteriota bacterium]
MDTKFFDEYQAQLLDWQKKFFGAWLDSLPKGTAEVKLTDTFETSLKLQEEMVKSYLEAQEKAAQTMLETQKQFWDNYFQALRQSPAVVN